MTGQTGRLVTKARCFWLSVVLLVGLQQYSGLWGSKTLVLDFLPMPLFYQVVVSLLAVVVWWIGTVVAWPDDGQESQAESVVDGLAQSAEEQA